MVFIEVVYVVVFGFFGCVVGVVGCVYELVDVLCFGGDFDYVDVVVYFWCFFVVLEIDLF